MTARRSLTRACSRQTRGGPQELPEGQPPAGQTKEALACRWSFAADAHVVRHADNRGPMRPILPLDELLRELDRIGADEHLRNGLATAPGVTADDVRSAIHATPDGAGTAGFERALRTQVAARRAREGSAGEPPPASGA